MNTQDEVKQTQRLTLPLYNLGCSSGDVLIVERILAQQSGVVEVYANPATETAYIVYDPGLTNEAHLTMVIKRAGFGPRDSKK
ncbi:MAG TPA: heavy metal-associated domain-containing protein [Chloroflexota bacterium]|nr:heavy metal-associated domain-containing protein [Chloroflexota bacterium]HUM67242.1 heavy metal-associated domain-containing protein [Chloroflexota bacterium]